MKKIKKLWILWAVAYGICAICGFLSNVSDTGYGLLILVGMGFFVPPGLLLFEAVQRKDRKTLKWVRNLSIASLSATLGMILINFLAFQSSVAWGKVLYWILNLVSVPMLCAQVWVIGLFGWACLLMTSLTYLRRK